VSGGTDAMALSSVSQMKENLTFGNSRIHGMGLCSRENIPARDFIIDYVGEVLRIVGICEKK
jgi:SET domain-containing protein